MKETVTPLQLGSHRQDKIDGGQEGTVGPGLYPPQLLSREPWGGTWPFSSASGDSSVSGCERLSLTSCFPSTPSTD